MKQNYPNNWVTSPELDTRSRRDDPETSKQAAKSIFDSITDKQNRVLEFLDQAGDRGLTDEELSDLWGTSGSTARTRRAELAERGMVQADGRRPVRSGNEAKVWKIAPAMGLPYTFEVTNG